jgi:hypothetical protein
MNPKLTNLLNGVCYQSNVVDTSHYSHFTYFNHRCWNVNPSENNNFWKGYCNLVDEGFASKFSGGPLSLGSKPIQNMPVISNIILEFADCDDSHIDDLYDESMIEKMVFCYQKVIRDNFKIITDDDDCAQLYCVVLESERAYKVDDKYVVNIRLVFPYCNVDTLYQDRIIRPKVIKLMRAENIFSAMYVTPSNDMEQMVDMDFIKHPIPLYGSITRPTESLLLLKNIYTEILDVDNVITTELGDIFDHTFCAYVKTGLLSEEIFEERGDDGELIYNDEHWLPIFLSPGYFNVITSPNDTLISLVANLPSSNISSSSGGISPAYIWIAQRILIWI